MIAVASARGAGLTETPASTVEAVVTGWGAEPKLVPHSKQNLAPGRRGVWQFGQTCFAEAT